ncbi:MAG: ABC transporter ATP-binding protein [Rhodospirillales bacterium]|nr:ABC transporter ATP-binding protein [Rhodospirillales bacterium]
MTPAVRFEGVSRHFGAVRAVDGVSFEVADGEFFAMLGPSGSGKTTCLRLIAGFEQPDRGHIEIHGKTAEGLPPYERDVNTVFQDYALFPHMTVADNVAYGPMIRGMAKAARRGRAEEMLALVKLEGLAGRKPGQLSGGQRQRVALARALINRPRVLLLDEPLGALDLKLREQMQVELKVLQRQIGITFVYVTHDQGEALAMSDRLAVFNEGRVEQIGTPAAVYEHPTSAFVAGFVGVSNILAPEVAGHLTGRAEACAIRPEKIAFLAAGEAPGAAACAAEGEVTEVQYLGPTTRYQVRLAAGGQLTVMRQNARGGGEAHGAAAGQRVRLVWDRGDVQVLGGAPEAGA